MLLLTLLVGVAAVAGSRKERVLPGVEAFPRSNRLVVYTYDAFPEALQVAVMDHFRDEHAAEVAFRRFEDSGGLLNQLLIEKADPQADVMIGLDTTYLGRIYEEELLRPYKPPLFRAVSDGLIVDREFRVVPFDYGTVTLNYDSGKLQDPPKTWDDLLDPAYKRGIILMNPSTSSPGRNFLLLTIAHFGEGGYLEFWRKLKPNILTVTAGWSEGYGLYIQGEASIVLSYDTSPAYHIMYEDETRYRNIFLDGEGYAQIEVAGIINGAENPTHAERFMDFIVSEPFQGLIPRNQIMYPVHPGVEIPEAFVKAGRANRMISLNASVVASKIGEWLEAWEETMR